VRWSQILLLLLLLAGPVPGCGEAPAEPHAPVRGKPRPPEGAVLQPRPPGSELPSARRGEPGLSPATGEPLEVHRGLLVPGPLRGAPKDANVAPAPDGREGHP